MSFLERSFGVAAVAVLLIAAPQGMRAQPPQGGPQQPPAPTGPMAPEKYKNIQILTNVPAAQIDATMRYVAAATSFHCVDCHVQEASGDFSWEKDDKRTKQTARSMMKMVYGVNAANLGVQVECATCHAGKNRPVGLPMAEMLTPEQVTAMMTPPPPPPGPPAGMQAGGPGGPGGPQGAAGASGGGRGGFQRVPGPPIDDVVNKYLAAVGGRSAVEKLQSLTLTGTVTNRAGQAAAFTIEEKANKYRETRQSKPDATVIGFDGTAGWQQTGARTGALVGFGLDLATRLNDVGNVLHLTEKYTNVQTSGRPTQINGKDTTQVSGRAGTANEQLYFEIGSGLLVRRIVTTRTPLGSLREQFDFADYRAAGDVKVPFEIKVTNWSTLDTYKVADAKANVTVADARFAKP